MLPRFLVRQAFSCPSFLNVRWSRVSLVLFIFVSNFITVRRWTSSKRLKAIDDLVDTAEDDVVEVDPLSFRPLAQILLMQCSSI